MSGRSAHVRKEKTKVKPFTPIVSKHPLTSPTGSEGAPSLYRQFPGPPGSNAENINNYYPELDCTSPVQSDFNTIKTGSSGSVNYGDDVLKPSAYAYPVKPDVTTILTRGETKVVKSGFRAKLDKKSDSIRSKLAGAFGGKSFEEKETRPPTASTTAQPGSVEMDSGGSSLQKITELHGAEPQAKTHNNQPQIYSWIGSKVEPWQYNLRRDMDGWDSHGDTYVYFASRGDTTSIYSTPSMRVHSFLLEDSGSTVLRDLLERGRVPNANGQARNPDQVQYRIHLPPPPTLSALDTTRHQIASRNLIALACGIKMVGFNFLQALTDLHERLEVSMMPDVDSAGRIIDWLKDLVGFDLRNNPSLTCSILAWSESTGVRWKEGWVEAFVHGVGMYNRMLTVPEWRNVSHVTRAHMENKDLALCELVNNLQTRLVGFNFDDMWPEMNSTEPTSQTSFKRAQKFFLEYYRATYEVWPPHDPNDPNGEELWLTRKLAQRMQQDFGGLYDYLVNRDVVWDCSEERSSRKWNIVHANNRKFQADTPDLPFTDVLVAFDNRHRYPHIPHPYCLIPQFPQDAQSPFKSNVKNGSSKSAGKKPNGAQDKIFARKIASAYTGATNVYQLRSDFVTSALIENFLTFEKNDQIEDGDLAAARRGRWVLIYMILQSLATLSVDTPGLAYKEGVGYHLCPPVGPAEALPPWRGQVANVEWARHEQSYCWATRKSWVEELLQDQGSAPPSVRPSYADSERSASLRSPTGSSLMSPTMRSMTSHSQQGRSHNGNEHDSYNNYPPGIEKLNEWPIREQENDYGSEYGQGGSRTGSEYGHSEYGHSRTTGSEYTQSRSAGSEYGYGRESAQGRRHPRSYNQDHSQHGSRDQSRDRLASNSPQEYASPVEQHKIPIRPRRQETQTHVTPSEEYASPIDNGRGFAQEYVTSPVEQGRAQSRSRRSPAAGSPPPVPPNHPGYHPEQAPVHPGNQIHDMAQIDNRDRSQTRRALPPISPISPLQYDPSRSGRSVSGNHHGSDGASDESLEQEREPVRTRRAQAPTLPPLGYVTGDHGRGQVLQPHKYQRTPVARQQNGQDYNF